MINKIIYPRGVEFSLVSEKHLETGAFAAIKVLLEFRKSVKHAIRKKQDAA